MESQPKFNLTSKSSAKQATAALIATMTVMGGLSPAQIIKNDGGKVEVDKNAAKEDVPVIDATAQSSEETQTLDQLSPTDLIKMLANDDFRIREQAHKLIWKLGKEMIPDLEKAVYADDPEISLRSADILRNLRIGVSHDTPKHIADKVAEFQDARLDKKDDILRFLYQEKAYNQMIFMLAEMENRDHAELLHKNFKELPFLAAREELSKENIDGAVELLKMSPQNDTVRRALAFVYARTGLAQAEYERLSELPNIGADDKEWILLLLEEMDERGKFREFAHKHGVQHSLDVLDLLAGDPAGLVKSFKRKPSVIQAVGVNVINDIYAGKATRDYADSHVRLLEEARIQLRKKKFLAMNTLFLTGGEKLGESILLEVAPTKAFIFLDERERPVEALAALGLTNDGSIIKWRDALIKSLVAPKDEQGKNFQQERLRKEKDVNYVDEEQHILEVASLYARHGAEDKAKLILDPLMDALRKLDSNDRWANIISDLPGYNMHELAMHYILDSAKDDEVALMVDVFFDGTNSVNLVWKELLRLNKDSKKSFKKMGILMGMYRGVDKERSKLENLLLKEAKTQGLDESRKMQEALYEISNFRIDSISAARYFDEIDGGELSDEAERAHIQEGFNIAALNLDWEGLLKMFEVNPEFGVNSSEWLTVRSIAERELGNIEKADQLLDRAMLLTVGQADEINEIFIELYWAGDMKRANDIVERELVIHSAATESYSFIRALGLLADANSHYLLSGQWKKASAVAYTSNYISLTFLQDRMSSPNDLTEMMKMNFTLNFSRGMQFYEAGEHEKAKRLLENANQCIVGDGTLADIFYPAVRKTPYKEEYKRWVQKSYDHLISAITDFPNASNTRNTLAWILSRSVIKMDEGIKHSAKALELAPNEAAYLDTMAELWFAKGDRKKAVEWGEKAVRYSKSGQLVGRASQTMTKASTLSLYGQLQRFKSEQVPTQ